MTLEELNAIEARAKAATPGAWIVKHCKTVYLADGTAEHEIRSLENGHRVAYLLYRMSGKDIGEDPEDLDAEFIAHARTDVPKLVEEVKRLRAAISSPCEVCTVRPSTRTWDKNDGTEPFPICDECRSGYGTAPR